MAPKAHNNNIRKRTSEPVKGKSSRKKNLNPLHLEVSGQLTLSITNRKGELRYYILPVAINDSVPVEKIFNAFERFGHLAEMEGPDGLFWYDEHLGSKLEKNPKVSVTF
jgi:hypothetical protein